MRSPGLLRLLRATLLIGLLAFFIWSLTSSLLAERGSRGIGPGGEQLGADPGVRVLLSDREEDVEHFRQLVFTALQPALLYCPDEPFTEDLQLSLSAQEHLVLRPEVNGIIIQVGPSQELRWSVSRVALRAQRASIPIPDNGPPPDLAGFETADRKALFQIRDRRYRGNLEVVRVGPSKLQAVNALPLEAYVTGVVQAEMGNYWPEEALMAQAIAARSFAFSQPSKQRAGGLLHYQLLDGGLNPTYRGVGRTGQRIRWSVNDTRGQILHYAGVPFAAWFHPSSGGHTASIEHVRPGARSTRGDIPLRDVMPSQPDPYCQMGVQMLDKQDTHWRAQTRISTGDLRKALIKRGSDNHWVYDIDVDREASGRVRRVILKILPDRQQELSGHEFRQMIGPLRLRSTLWTPGSPEKLEGSGQERGGYRITTIGWGHGVGMSQVSAYAMARKGWSARDILERFYVGAYVQRLWW